MIKTILYYYAFIPSLARRGLRSGLLFLFFIIRINIFSQQSLNIELVESIPVETTLDNHDIRNTQEVWLEMINSAQKTLDIEQFYITSETGEPLDTVLNAIIVAARRGVEVRIIVDKGMYNTYPADVSRLDAESYFIETRTIDIKSLTGGIQHAKFFIVDGEQIFLGSQNFDWRALKHIHELGVRIKNIECVYLYESIFEGDWCLCANDRDKCWIRIPQNSSLDFNNDWGKVNVQSSYSSNLICDIILPITKGQRFQISEYSENSTDIYQIKKIINNASSEITLQFLSYNVIYKDEYWNEVDSALIKAAARGVKVKLIISDWNLGKTAVEHFKQLISNPNIEIRYTAIPEYSGGYIPFARVEHCKFITADSVCWIGTSNMSKDYFYKSRNVGVVIENAKFTQRVRDIFYKSWNSEYAHKIEEGGIYEMRKHGE